MCLAVYSVKGNIINSYHCFSTIFEVIVCLLGIIDSFQNRLGNSLIESSNIVSQKKLFKNINHPLIN